MRIYEMTATFGKLEHATLRLQPGMNVIQAPNEWGKSTWCAFLMAMLYGLDTRAKSTKTALADKEHYLPWSGSPMAGRIDLNWQGRDITIERRTRGRIPLGHFRVYETATGLEIPELTAANCGAVLLGVEQSVFRRAGFIRRSDLPVTQDEALRRRLNELVTTGDESGEGDRLEENLRELRNRCRHNRTGLIPQTQEQLQILEEKTAELESLETHCRRLKQRLEEIKSWLQALENHRAALRYAAAEADAHRVAEARDARDQAEKVLTAMEAACADLPGIEETERRIHGLLQLRDALEEVRAETAEMETAPEEPELPEPWQGMQVEQAEELLEQDIRRYEALRHSRAHWVWLLMAVILLASALSVAMLWEPVPGAVIAGAGLVLLVLGLWKGNRSRQQRKNLAEKYGTKDPGAWRQNWKACRAVLEDSRLRRQKYQVRSAELEERRSILEKQRETLCGSQSLDGALEQWRQTRGQQERCQECHRIYQNAQTHFLTLQSMARSATRPAFADTLTLPEAETEEEISRAREEQRRLLNRLGQYQGRMEAIGDRQRLENQHHQLRQRLEKLTQTYDALTLALETLNRARQELQRRFAPRIVRRAQDYLNRMTGGRYDRLQWQGDFSLLAGAEGEDTLRQVLWRSDGTMDQLYLALRMAVAGELMPDAPLILDDVLVCFDDERMAEAMNLLWQEGQSRQVILFTCQSREKNWMNRLQPEPDTGRV